MRWRVVLIHHLSHSPHDDIVEVQMNCGEEEASFPASTWHGRAKVKSKGGAGLVKMEEWKEPELMVARSFIIKTGRHVPDGVQI